MRIGTSHLWAVCYYYSAVEEYHEKAHLKTENTKSAKEHVYTNRFEVRSEFAA